VLLLEILSYCLKHLDSTEQPTTVPIGGIMDLATTGMGDDVTTTAVLNIVVVNDDTTASAVGDTTSFDIGNIADETTTMAAIGNIADETTATGDRATTAPDPAPESSGRKATATNF